MLIYFNKEMSSLRTELRKNHLIDSFKNDLPTNDENKQAYTPRLIEFRLLFSIP